MASQDQINSLTKRKEELYKFIDIASKKNEADNFEKKSQKMVFGTIRKKQKYALKN